MSTPRRTQADPNGLAKLYLRTPEIQTFFQAYVNYYTAMLTRNQRRFWTTLLIYLGVCGMIFLWLLSEFEIGDDEEIMIFILFGIGVVVGLFVILGMASSKKGKLQKQLGKGQLLSSFFQTLQYDIHPESGLKGVIDHRKHEAKHKYKSKTSPYSGAKKLYYKYPWAVLKFTLVDGTSFRLKMVDKLKEKNSSIVRFQEIGKGKALPNSLLFEVDRRQQINFRRELCQTEADLNTTGSSLGQRLAKLFKENYRSLPRRSQQALKSTLEQPAPQPAVQPKTAKTLPTSSGEKQAQKQLLRRIERLLRASELPGLIFEPLGQGLEVNYKPPGRDQPYTLWLELCQDTSNQQENYLSLRLPIMGQTPEVEKLLRANPALAHGRFAYYSMPNSGKRQLCLLKTLLLETLDREELETAISGLAQLGGKMAEYKALPEKAKAYKAERHPEWERMLLENALQGLPVELETQENKFKCRLKLEGGRAQTVHVRFDRQDPEGNQLISLLSYCGGHSPDLYETLLEENARWSYGAVGLAHLGAEEMFVVSDNQLAQTADPPELKQAILHVAQKADTLEALVTGADQH